MIFSIVAAALAATAAADDNNKINDHQTDRALVNLPLFSML